jgi:hypothetical protein
VQPPSETTLALHFFTVATLDPKGIISRKERFHFECRDPVCRFTTSHGA